MDNNIEKRELTPEFVRRHIGYSRAQKEVVRGWWNAASAYYNNHIQQKRRYDPSVLITGTDFNRWGLDNLIPHSVRGFAAWVMDQSLSIRVEANGASDDMLRTIVARTIREMLEYYCKQPQFRNDMREIAIRMKLYNMVGQYDYWDEMREIPASKIITHDDIFCDTTSVFPANTPNGPKWVAIRRMLTHDEAVNRYGVSKVKNEMTQGAIAQSDEREADYQNTLGGGGDDRYQAYRELYEIYEWFGIDETEIAVSKEETEEIAGTEIVAFLNGEGVEPNEDINHQQAIDYGDSFMMTLASENLGGVNFENIDSALQAMGQAGMVTPAEGYLAWRQLQTQFIDDDEAGGFKAKYPGYIYHAEFQASDYDFLIKPETLEYPHYQIPVSLYRAHLNTDTMFGPGPMAEVLPLQAGLEYWEKAMNDHAHYQARPNFVIDMDSLDPTYATDNGRSTIVRNLKEGFKVLWLRTMSQRGGKNVTPHWAAIGKFDQDVMRIMEYKRHRIQEIIGPTNVMKGQVSGETSGRAYAMRQEAAAKPVTDTLMLIEGPMEMLLNRKAANLIAYAPLEKVASISGAQAAQAMNEIRMNDPNIECAVTSSIGRGMPQDWNTKSNLMLHFANMGMIDAKTLENELQLPFPLKEPPPPEPPGGMGTAKGGNQNQAVPQLV